MLALIALGTILLTNKIKSTGRSKPPLSAKLKDKDMKRRPNGGYAMVEYVRALDRMGLLDTASFVRYPTDMQMDYHNYIHRYR